MKYKLPLLLFVVILLLYSLFYYKKVPNNPYEVKYLIGVSQSNLGEPWRIKMNNEIMAEAKKHEGLQVIYTDASQDNQKQVEDIESLVAMGIDLLIVSPNESEPLTEIISKTYQKIPVIVLDRSINSPDYTLFIGADNHLIGQKAGEYVVSHLTQSDIKILEVKGLLGSTPAVERSNGFHLAIDAHPRIEVVETVTANWLRDVAEDLLAERIEADTLPAFDVVYAHNDPMAYGAYKALVKHGYTDKKYIGIDALTGSEGGVTLVEKGILDCTFTYPTGGKEAILYAIDILNNIYPSQKEIILDSEIID